METLSQRQIRQSTEYGFPVTFVHHKAKGVKSLETFTVSGLKYHVVKRSELSKEFGPHPMVNPQ